MMDIEDFYVQFAIETCAEVATVVVYMEEG